MSLISQICDLETQKTLLTSNLLFAVERILGQYTSGKIDEVDASKQIGRIIDGEKPQVAETKKSTEEQDSTIKFVSDYAETNYETGNDSEITFVADSVSSMFDSYLKPKNSGDFQMSFVGTANQKVPYKPVPTCDWSKIISLNDCAILYRTHSQSRAIEETLLKNKVPYRLVSGTRFLDRKEIKDVMAILKFLSNGSDKIALTRFLPLVMDGVGAKTLEKILAFLEDYDYLLAEKFQKQIFNLLQNLQHLWINNTSLIEFTKEALIVSGYHNYLKKEYPIKEEFQDRMENIGEIYSLMLPLEENKEMTLEQKLNEFLTQMLLMSQLDNSAASPDEPKINLMTLHQSKGLEFETVFLVGCEDGLLPHSNSFMENSQMEEEVRLAYVGVTRAKKNLFLTAAESRVTFGQVKFNPISRIFRPFLDKNCVRLN